MIRTAIASAANDHRLGANEAPPSIISVFLGETLEKIYDSILDGKSFNPEGSNTIDLGVNQLAALLKDNTDRNRTSPFAFTGNRFELRAVGSSMPVGLPLSILNAAIAEGFKEVNEIFEAKMKADPSLTVDKLLLSITKDFMSESKNVVFNGDGYGKAWLEEAEKRGLPNLKTTADALGVLTKKESIEFLTGPGIYKSEELETRYNVLVETYNVSRTIEFKSLSSMVHQYILPAAIDYKLKLAELLQRQKELGLETLAEVEIYKKINFTCERLYERVSNLNSAVVGLGDDINSSLVIANELMPLSEEIATSCNELEELLPDNTWGLPKYFDMLFLK